MVKEYEVSDLTIDWNKLRKKTILISGATGLVGKRLIEVLLERNKLFDDNIHIIAIGRNKSKFVQRFLDVNGIACVEFIEQDINTPVYYEGDIDYVVHLASNTHPRLYATDPIGTVLTNIRGTYNLLELVASQKACRFVFASSGDVYGDNRSSKEFFAETDCGYIDCNTLRAGYIEGKRAGEALCNAYREAKGIDFVTARFCRLYGEEMPEEDSKAISQFIRNAANYKDIVLKSAGIQEFSYLCISDAITALLTIMLKGKNGEAYNVADSQQNATLSLLASMCAEIGGVRVIKGLQDEQEKKGASTFSNVKLDASKLYNLGWEARVDLKHGLQETILSLRQK